MIALTMPPRPSRLAVEPDDCPVILACDTCGAKASPSKAEASAWRSELGYLRGRLAVVDVCPRCVATMVPIAPPTV